MSVVTRSMNKATSVKATPIKATSVKDTPVKAKADALGKKTNTNNYNLRNTPSVTRSDDDEKKELEEEKEKRRKKEEEEEEDLFRVTFLLASTDELAGLNLTPGSKDPSGKYNIVANVLELSYIHIRLMGEDREGQWAIAPPGYYWIQLSQNYHNCFWEHWIELRRIPV
jgi:hypothetical protein